MRLLVTLLAAGGLALAAFASALAQPGGELKPGDAAPPFSLTGSDGKSYSLSAYIAKQAVVLAWFPKAFTGG
jgi:peroxiredoxin Q/BCP